MDFQVLLNIILGSASGLLGWLARELWSAVKELRKDLSDLREQLPKEYIAKDDFKDAITEIKSLLISISAKLDTKADK